MDVKKIFGPRFVKTVKRPVWLATKALTGRRLQASTHFSDLEMFGGKFDADAEAVTRRLPPGFRATEQRPGDTFLRIMGIDYRRTDVMDPYREVAIKIPVSYASSSKGALDGWWILQMPVTSEEARWGGVDNYGYPKFLADVQLQQRGKQRVCRLVHNGVFVFEMTVDELSTNQMSETSRNFTVRDDGVVVESTVEIQGDMGEAEDSGGAKLELGFHQIADQLRAMGVATTGRVVMIPSASAVLSAGRVIDRI